MSCTSCARAAADVDSPFQHAGCKGCAVRALAQSPDFYRGGIDGGDAKPYRKALALIFGDDWRAGHDLVLAEAARIKKARSA